MKIVLIAGALIAALFLILRLGLIVRPAPFAPYPERTPELKKVPLPEGLPGPVERFFRKVYGESLPVVETVVITGRAVLRTFLGIPFPARFIFVHRAGKDYRHYIEATWFGLPVMKVNEGYLDGKSFFEGPMGRWHDDPGMNQAANLALWAEAAWFPSLLVTDPRVSWAPVDADSAILSVPFEDGRDRFLVRFDPATGLIALMEAMRFRNPGDREKILWMTKPEKGGTIAGTPLSAAGSATWLDQGRPWAVFRVEDIVINADVGPVISRRGL